jgi:hypothetical protein
MTGHVQLLVKLAEAADLFRTSDGRAYATVPVKAHYEHWPVRSKQFIEWLARSNFQKTGELARLQDLREATKAIEAKTLFDGPELSVFIRVGEHDGRCYLDLSNEEWQVVEIDAQGWRVVTAPSVKFIRTEGTQALPLPVSGGSINELRPFVNVAGQSDWSLLVGYAVSALRHVGPFPILSLCGEHGTAKSTLARLMRGLVDPRSAGLRAQPRNVHDLMIAAQNTWILSFDNLSFIPAWFSDALCRLATGGGFATRQLHTDTHETLFDAQRPVVLTGIGELATRSDLLDRSITIELPRIPDSERRCEQEFWPAFNAAHPRILGALLDAVSHGLKNLPSTTLSHSPRMADLALWVSAAESGFGWANGTFLSAYDDNRAEANQIALEASPITAPLFALLTRGPWQGTATALLKVLAQSADENAKHKPGWPQTETSLSLSLRRLATNLRSAGAEVSFGRKKDRCRTRTISLRILPSAVSAPSEPAEWGTEVERAGAAGRGTALIDEGQRRLFEISDRALAAGDHKAAVAAVREAINSTKLMPQNHSAVDGFVNAMQEISDEQLDAVQRSVASDAGKTGGSGEATAPEHEQSS